MQSVESDRDTGAPDTGLVQTIRELAGACLSLVRNTVQLAACEGRAVARRLALRVTFLVVALVVAAIGVLLILGGAAVALVQAGVPLWAGLVGIGVIAVAGGVIAALRVVAKLSDPDLSFQGTLDEIEADAAALRCATDEECA